MGNRLVDRVVVMLLGAVVLALGIAAVTTAITSSDQVSNIPVWVPLAALGLLFGGVAVMRRAASAPEA